MGYEPIVRFRVNDVAGGRIQKVIGICSRKLKQSLTAYLVTVGAANCHLGSDVDAASHRTVVRDSRGSEVGELPIQPLRTVADKIVPVGRGLVFQRDTDQSGLALLLGRIGNPKQV